MKKKIIIAILSIVIIGGGATIVVTSNNDNTKNEVTRNINENNSKLSNIEEESNINTIENKSVDNKDIETVNDVNNKGLIDEAENNNKEVLNNIGEDNTDADLTDSEEQKNENIPEEEESNKPDIAPKPEVNTKPEVTPEPEVTPKPEVDTKPEVAPEPEIEENSSFMDQVESMIITKVNEERSKVGLAPLAYNSTMEKYARIKSQDMGDRNYFDHKNPEGELITAQMERDGVSYMAWGENIAYISGQSNATALANQFMSNWMNSSGHKANILSDNFTDIGVGVYKIGSKVYATQEFYR